MKLLRYGLSGQERPGLLDSDGRIRDLSRDVADIGPDCLTPAGLAGLAKLIRARCSSRRVRPARVPVARVGKFIAIGLNFVDHAAESNPIPKEPVVFTKATSSLAGPNDQVMLPKDSAKSDWEVELGVVIGRRASYVEQTEALDHVAGYCVVNDVSEREYQSSVAAPGTRARLRHLRPRRPLAGDEGRGAGPAGTTHVARREWKAHADRYTRTMIFGVAEIVSYLSRFMTLLPGDIVTTHPARGWHGDKAEPSSSRAMS